MPRFVTLSRWAYFLLAEPLGRSRGVWVCAWQLLAPEDCENDEECETQGESGEQRCSRGPVSHEMTS